MALSSTAVPALKGFWHGISLDNYDSSAFRILDRSICRSSATNIRSHFCAGICAADAGSGALRDAGRTNLGLSFCPFSRSHPGRTMGGHARGRPPGSHDDLVGHSRSQFAASFAAGRSRDLHLDHAACLPDPRQYGRFPPDCVRFLNAGRTAVALDQQRRHCGRFLAGARTAEWPHRPGRSLLLALDPFLGGLSGLFHVDGFLATWSTLSLLALALGIGLGQKERGEAGERSGSRFPVQRPHWQCSAKRPGLLLLLVAALALLTVLWREDDASVSQRLASYCGYGAVWAGSFLAYSPAACIRRSGRRHRSCWRRPGATPAATLKKLCAQPFSWAMSPSIMVRCFTRPRYCGVYRHWSSAA